MTRLAVWSGPRTISTALMRSWENRPDTIVIDEPLYAHYLNATGLDHPGRAEVIGAGETDWGNVVATLVGPVPDGTRVFYQKHMAHHLLPGDRSRLGDQPHERPADPRPAGGGRVLRSFPRRRHRRGPGTPPADPALRRAGGVGNAAARGRRARLPPRSRVLPTSDVPPRRGGLHPPDAGVAAGPAGLRRGVGPVLVRRGVEIDRVRRVPTSGYATGQPGRRGRRGMPAPVRTPPRRHAGCSEPLAGRCGTVHGPARSGPPPAHAFCADQE